MVVVRFQGCLWRGPAPRHTCPSMSMCASSSTSSLVLVRFRSRLLGASGSRVVSLCLSRCSGVGRAGGLASLSPFVGAVQAAGIFASVRGFGGRRGRGLGIPWPLPGCQGRFFFSVASGLCQCGWCSFLFWRQGVFGAKVFVPRLLNQCRLVFLLLGLVFFGEREVGSRARGFVSRFCFGVDWISCLLAPASVGASCTWFVSRFRCWGLLASLHLWLVHVFDTDSNMAVFALCHLMEFCREVGGTHLWVLAVVSLLVAAQFIACCDGVWIDTSHLHIVRTTTTTTTTNTTTTGLRVTIFCELQLWMSLAVDFEWLMVVVPQSGGGCAV